jgi:hypothetical protein
VPRHGPSLSGRHRIPSAHIARLFRSGGRSARAKGVQARASARRRARFGNDAPRSPHGDLQTQDWDALPDEALRLSRRTFDCVDGIIEEALTYWPEGGEPTTANYQLRIYSATELKRMALEAGFLDIQFYGDAAGGPLSRDSRLVLVARPATTAD